MNDLLEKLKTFIRLLADLGKKAYHELRRFIVWVSPPQRLTVAVIACLFAISLLSWAIGDRNHEAVLYFPKTRGSDLKTELRLIPRSFNTETRAELVASEVLLGPVNPGMRPAFPQGSRVASSIYRHGILYLDLSEEAALGDKTEISAGLAALTKSLKVALPWARRFVVTIGGVEPYKDGLLGASEGPKKSEKN